MVQDNRVYAAMMKSYDDSLAKIRAKLASTKDPRHPGKMLSETTILVITSDHGGKSTTPVADNKSLENDEEDSPQPGAKTKAYSAYPTSNYPLRQGKTWVYEGGLKIPLIVYAPGITTAGATTEAFVHGADFFASFVDMAGGNNSQTTVQIRSASYSAPVNPMPAHETSCITFSPTRIKGREIPRSPHTAKGCSSSCTSWFNVEMNYTTSNTIPANNATSRASIQQSYPVCLNDCTDSICQRVQKCPNPEVIPGSPSSRMCYLETESSIGCPKPASAPESLKIKQISSEAYISPTPPNGQGIP